MDTRTVADVEGWESRPFDGGYDGLHDLADREFTGCVVAGDGYLFMVRGRVVGVFEYAESATGDSSVAPAEIDRFEDAGGTAYEAPHDALALLFAMAASGGETRGRYYSKDTPLEEVDRTLRDGGFTGYLELSENVLSGDYYLVYHGGRRRSVAFVGQSRRLKADEEAFDLAADEVGIYEVTAVPLSTAEIPGSPGAGDTAVVPDTGLDPTGDRDEDGGGDADVGSPGGDSPDDTAGTARTAGTTGTTGEAGPGGDTGPDGPDIDLDAAMNPRAAEDDEEASGAADASRASPSGGTAAGDPGSDDPHEGAERDAADSSGGSGVDGSVDLGEVIGADDIDAGGEPADEDADEAGGDENETDEADAVGETDADEAEDPDAEVDATAPNGTPDEGREGESTVESAGSAVPDDETDDPGEATPEDVEAATAAEAETDDGRVVPSVDPDRTARAPPDGAPGAGERVIDGETVVGLRSELSAREDRIEELRERLEAVEAARDELETERNELAERVAELERRLAESGAAPLENTREMSPAEALSGTSVLVRYRSKSEPTLAEAHDGQAVRDSLAANLVLEPHTTFETDGLSVAGRTFDSFLEESQGYAFLRWLVGELVYEIRDTESASSLGPLYDAIPTLDRVEFDAAVALEGADRETTRFDFVGRDRRGNPLFVAHLEDDRAPTTSATMGGFLTDATAAAESHESLVAAFAVTASYFEPEALTTAEDAAGGSLLSRSKRKSFVKTSRKGGYHLCLVEDREESFYLSVPDL